MLHLELSEEERGLLHDVLTMRLHDIRHEIHHTDQREFKGRLAHQEELLRRLLTVLAPGPAGE